MLVLGINDGHDAGACLIQDGRVVLVSNEERRINQKNAVGIPRHSISALFQRSGINPQEVDLITLSSRIRTIPPTHKKTTRLSILKLMWSAGRTQWGTKFGRWLLPKLRDTTEIKRFLADFQLGDKPIQAMDHHACHAATAFFHRPWEDEATVLTLDGAGDGLCATVGVGRNHELSVLASTPKFHSPAAWMYSAVTAHLGLKPYEHEYKVMGMAPYGQAKYCIDIFRKAFAVNGLYFQNNTGVIGAANERWYHRHLFQQRFDNICAGVQQHFEEMMVQWVRNAIAVTGCKKVVAAGGAFLNVKANKLIREMPEVEAFYAYPASDDGGTPIGAAYLGYLQLCKSKGVVPTIEPPRSMYQGLSFSQSEIEAAIQKSGLPHKVMSDPSKEIASLLAEGKIIARFAGQEEIGPRSLGNRCIMADPRDLGVIRKLNFAIKQRDFWMPFAASILEEDAEKYIQNPTKWAFYMIEAFDSTPEGAEMLIAGSHPFDRTIRPQIVNELNPSYRDIIRAFKAKTGVGGVLNTSFNLHGSPIVGTPEVAIYTLINSELDALALENYLVWKPK